MPVLTTFGLAILSGTSQSHQWIMSRWNLIIVVSTYQRYILKFPVFLWVCLRQDCCINEEKSVQVGVWYWMISGPWMKNGLGPVVKLSSNYANFTYTPQACFRGGFRFWNQKSFIWSFGAHISSWETASTVGKVGKLFPFKDKNELLSIQKQKRLFPFKD